MKGVKSANSRIWRTVVFSGAMLGAPLVSADSKAPKAPPQQLAKPKPPPSPEEELASAKAAVDAAVRAINAAKSEAARDAAKVDLDRAFARKAAAEAKIAARKKQSPSVDKLQKELADLDAKVAKAIDDVVAAQNDAERQAAVARLRSLRVKRAAADRRLTAARNPPPPKRPRGDGDRPVGRGFVLA